MRSLRATKRRLCLEMKEHKLLNTTIRAGKNLLAVKTGRAGLFSTNTGGSHTHIVERHAKRAFADITDENIARRSNSADASPPTVARATCCGRR